MNFEKYFDRLYSRFFTTKILYTLIFIFLVLFIISFWHRYIQIDENWFGEQAYSLANSGIIRLQSMPGILQFDQQVFVYHKLLVLLGAFIVLIFGWSVYYFKVLVLLFYALFFVCYRKYFLNNTPQQTKQHLLTSSFLVLLFPLMVSLGFTFRPEIPVMACGFISYYFLDRYFSERNNKLICMAGAMAGLAFLVTTNAIIFPISGAILLIYKKKWKGLLLFSAFSLLVCSLYCWDLWQPGHFEMFIYQLKGGIHRKFGQNLVSINVGSLLLFKLKMLLDEHQRFFWSDRVQLFSVLFWLVLIFNFNFLRRNYSNLLVYMISLILSLNLFGSHIAERYLVYYLPFMAIIISVGLFHHPGKYFRILKYVYFLLIMGIFVFCAKQYAFVFSQNQDSVKIHRELLARLPDQNAVVFAPWRFIYNGIEKYRIISYQALEYYQDEFPKMMTQSEITELLKVKYNVKYLVLDDDLLARDQTAYPWFSQGIEPSNQLLKVIFRNDHYIIAEIQDPIRNYLQ